MKKLPEVLVCFLHPLAVVPVWIGQAIDQPDLGTVGKLAGRLSGQILLTPFMYLFTGGDLW